MSTKKTVSGECKTTHYRHGPKTLCGLYIERKNKAGKTVRLSVVREFGEVSCRKCCASIKSAGLKVLGVRK